MHVDLYNSGLLNMVIINIHTHTHTYNMLERRNEYLLTKYVHIPNALRDRQAVRENMRMWGMSVTVEGTDERFSFRERPDHSVIVCNIFSA